jgi:hypothetical protein
MEKMIQRIRRWVGMIGCRWNLLETALQIWRVMHTGSQAPEAPRRSRSRQRGGIGSGAARSGSAHAGAGGSKALEAQSQNMWAGNGSAAR